MFDTLDTSLSLIEVAFGMSAVRMSYSTPSLSPAKQVRGLSKTEQYQASTAMDPGATISNILEELGDVLTIESWSVIFGWIEGRGEDITLVSKNSVLHYAPQLICLFSKLVRNSGNAII